MSGSRIALLICAALLLLAPLHPAAAQEQDLQIRITQVDNSNFPQVTVYVSVTNADGEPVGVDPSLIQLYENGVLVQPDLVSGEGEAGPLTTMLVMDVSGSMYNGGKLEAAKTAAKAYVTQMRPGDEAGLIAFNTQVTYVQSITADHAALEAGIDSLTARDDTAMFDALAQAIQILQGETGRKAIIALTDGLDNRSTITAEEVVSAVGPGGLSISTIGLGDPAAQGTNYGLDEAGLRSLAERAGGLYGFAQDAESLQALYESYGRALQSEYRITYTSPSTLRDGVNRTLTVSLGEAGQVSADAQYNPGGVLPEVSGKSWTLFVGVLAGLVVLAFLPGLLRRFVKPGAGKPSKAGKKKSRIKLK
ncbi:MAG: VWA domain-containing protein [Anaerolineales bacterium]|nr:VWA domain-containing protein [Anaerolineales bacterium]MDP2974771.1 VWA domain-containing protein [Anaerolineales bacterium]